MAEFTEAIKKYRKMCSKYFDCKSCPLMEIRHKLELDCNTLVLKYPETVEPIIMDWEESVDWSKVEIDTPILVRNSVNEEWEKRYFAEYDNDMQVVCAWASGRTSWTAATENDIMPWEFAKLADDD